MEADPLIGQVVASRYRILKKMGEGGMGTVYLAEHVTIEKKVALKILLSEYSRKEELKERFLREAKAASRINHENIIDITDFGETAGGSVFFAMEFLEGRDLSEVIKEDGPMPWNRARSVLLQICRALGAAHSKEIIHRDMKPENIFLIEREGRPDFVKVLDFGIAKVEDERQSRLTRTGMIFGTPEYMSPEQAQGHSPDHRIDVYAVGVIMYELLTGEVPFKADTFMGILTKHIFEAPVAPREVAPNREIPLQAEAIILKAMTKDREERFKSMTEMAAAIQQVSGRMTHSTSDLPSLHIASSNEAGKGGPTGPRKLSSAPDKGRVAAPIETIPPEIAGTRSKLVIIIILLLVLLGSGAAAMMLLGGNGDEKKAAKPPTTPPPEKKKALAVTKGEKKHAPVKITITSKPANASIFRDEKELGKTPYTLELPFSDVAVLFKLKLDGYNEAEQSIIPNQKGPLTVPVELAKLEPKKVAKKRPRKRVHKKRPPKKVEPPKKVKPRKPKKPRRPRKQDTGQVDKGDIRNPFD